MNAFFGISISFFIQDDKVATEGRDQRVAGSMTRHKYITNCLCSWRNAGCLLSTRGDDTDDGCSAAKSERLMKSRAGAARAVNVQRPKHGGHAFFFVGPDYSLAAATGKALLSHPAL